MARIDQLLRNYERYVALPWETSLAGPERVWFAVYDKMDERRVRARADEFELATKRSQHDWQLTDLSAAFAEWMAGQKYRDSYFQDPDSLEIAISEFKDHVVARLGSAFSTAANPEKTVFAVLGVACLFGFLRASDVIRNLETKIKGRLLVFFPGEYENNNYRLLDARDGWNYLAVPITAEEGIER